MANRRYIDFPIASTSGDSDIILIWQDGANKQTTKATFLSGLPENLDELNDVAISGLTNGQILRYDSVTGKWENTDQGNLDLNDLNDVSIVSPSNGQVLVYNSSTSQWENSSGGYVPYTGAVTTVNLGAQQLIAGQTTLTTNGSADTLTVNHTSGSGKAINVTKGGNGEGLYINKTSGSGNAATIVGTLEATTLVKTGGTSSQFLKADGSVDSTSYGTGTVTSVGLSSATSGVTIGSSPVTTSGTITLAIATASGSQNGLLSSTDWTTFNSKQNALTNPVTGTGTTNYLPKFTGASTIGNSQVFDNGTVVGIATTALVADALLPIQINAGPSGQAYFASNNNGGYGLIMGYDNANGYARIRNVSNTALTFETNNSEKMRLTNSGNLGLGVTPSAWSTSFGIKVIDVGNQGTFYASDNDANISFNQFFNGTNAVYKTTGTASRFALIGNEFQWRQAPSGTAGNAISFNQAMTLFATGNLLVGTGSDNGSRLQVSGTATVDGVAFIGQVFTYGTDFTQFSHISRAGADQYSFLSQNNGGTYVNSHNSQSIFFRHNNSNLAVITSGGSVGIGTSSPGQRLHVIDTQTSNTSILQLRLEGNGGNFYDIGRRYDSGAFVIQGNQTGFNNICLAPSGGNVLIGTTTDGTQKLRIAGTTRMFKLVTGEAGLAADNYTEFSNDDNVGYINTNRVINNGDFHFRFDGTSRANINRTTGVYTATSDLRLKSKIENSQSAMPLINQIKVRQYQWNESLLFENFGFIAQELEEILPNYIHKPINDNDFWKISKSELVPLLVKAIQELKQEIDTLKN